MSTPFAVTVFYLLTVTNNAGQLRATGPIYISNVLERRTMPHYAGQNGPAGEIRLPSFQERPVNFVDVCPAGLRDAVGGVSWPGRAAGQA